jgi:flagellar basal body P-ring formation protein FlgA
MWRLLAFGGLMLASCLTAAADGIAIPVPNLMIRAGDTMTGDLLTERKMVVSETAARSYVVSREQAVGKVARRALAAGAAIPLNALREPWLFKDGERVAIQFVLGGLNIRGAGLALQPGVLGDVIGVRNIDTGVTVRGTVQADGSVQVEGAN